MPVKNKKTPQNSPRSKKPLKKKVSARWHKFWLALLIIGLLITAVMVISADRNEGLADISAPRGSLERELQLDTTELEQEAEIFKDYDNRQIENSTYDEATMKQLGEVADNAEI